VWHELFTGKRNVQRGGAGATHSYVWRDLFLLVTWLIHTCHVTGLQVNATCNVEGGRFNDWFTGHLNYQIEHHLFPTMPRHNYSTVAPLVLCIYIHTHTYRPARAHTHPHAHTHTSSTRLHTMCSPLYSAASTQYATVTTLVVYAYSYTHTLVL